jgi:mannose-6-phosphate isomerase-like protein (cupin superfamily)
MAIVAMALMGALAGPVFAQEEPLPEGVSLDYLAFATAADVPADAHQLVLFRMLLAPGAVFRITPEQEGVALAEVERGVLTTTVDGPVQIARARAEPGVEETIAGGETFTLDRGDSALYGAGLSGDIRNEGSEEVSLLILEALVLAPMQSGSPIAATPAANNDATMSLPAGITVQFLATGETPDLPNGAIFSLSRVGYGSGVSPGVTAQLGSQVALVESGVFAIAPVEGPPVTVFHEFGTAIEAGEESALVNVGSGEEADIAAGDSAYFPAGNLAVVSNNGSESAAALLGIVIPADAATE